MLFLLSGRENGIASAKFVRRYTVENIRRAMALRQHDFRRHSIKKHSVGNDSSFAADSAPLRVNNSARHPNRETRLGARKIIVNYSPTLVVQGGSNVPDVEARLLEAISRSGYELAKILDREYARRARVELL
jgi:hypothetical protein